ncbi:hypothetical protein [Micromonospora rosaria]|uniref:hypothetical protein n=1 Tax=Micromonospora rosaria TaxID=47874 RepID=UPI000AE307B9|nr:hypothetical protein [Micromonospora rosaria]
MQTVRSLESGDWLEAAMVAQQRPEHVDAPACQVWIEAGQTVTITIPTIVDGVAEPAEQFRRLRIYEPDWRGTIPGPEVTATVVD